MHVYDQTPYIQLPDKNLFERLPRLVELGDRCNLTKIDDFTI